MVKFACLALLFVSFACKSHKKEIEPKNTVGTPSKTMVVPTPPSAKVENIMDPPKPPEILLVEEVTQVENPKKEATTEGIAPKQDTSNAEPIHQIVEQMPEFPGGQAALNAWLVKNLEYPKMAREQGIEGRVFVQFNVYKTGVCGNFTILRSPSPILSNAALKTMKKMPNWKPGMQNGKAVNTVMRLPISYKLQ